MNIELDENFHRHRTLALAPDALRSRVSTLGDALNQILSDARGCRDEDVFQAGMDLQIVEALKRSGHHLWSWDFDGKNVERSSYDYTNEESCSLVLDIHRQWKVRCDWIVRAPHSGERRFIVGVCDPGFGQDEWAE